MGLGLTAKQDCGCGCGGAKKSDWVKAKYSFYSALVFFILSNPETFKLTRKVFGAAIGTEDGCPRTGGLFLHTLVFMVVLFLLMKIGA
jgi:hypothetical protein